jgi:hypothetical protein
MRQFMQACLFAFTDVVPAVRADLDPTLKSVSAAASPSAHHGYRADVSRERSLEPAHLLDNMDVTCTMLMAYYSIVLDQHCTGHLADRQAGCQLRVIRCFL